METITSTFTGKLEATEFPKSETTKRVRLENIQQFLAEFIISQNIKVRSTEFSFLAASESMNRFGEIKRKPAIASLQLYRGFLNISDEGSIYHKNNGKNTSVGYVKVEEDGTYSFVLKADEKFMDEISGQLQQA